MDYFVVLFRSFETNILVFARILSIFAFTPLLSRKNVPVMVRVILSIFITMIVIMVVQPDPIDSGTQAGIYLMMILREVFIGLVLGFITNMFFNTVQVAGEIMDMQSGLGMAKVFDPETNVQMSIIGSIISFMMYLYFFATNAHMSYIQLFVISFDTLPVGGSGFNPDLGYNIVSYFSVLLAMVTKLAMPIIAAAFVLEFCMGMLMKSVPQIQIMVVNIQLKVAVGFSMLFLIAIPVADFVDKYLDTWLDTLGEFLTIMPA